MKKLHDFNVGEIARILEDPYTLWTSNLFNRLRALVVCRITLFNARRGGEPARLLLKEWEEAKADAWIDPQRVCAINDPLEKQLLTSFKLAYQFGKGRKLVPLLIPVDCTAAIEKLVEVREEFVRDGNPYVFPFTQNSLDHASGWHCVHEVCVNAKITEPRRLTATKMRHRASTLYALQEVPQANREAFFRHMGHSKEVNEEVYQAPHGITEVLRVGSFLEEIDRGSNPSTETSEYY